MTIEEALRKYLAQMLSLGKIQRQEKVKEMIGGNYSTRFGPTYSRYGWYVGDILIYTTGYETQTATSATKKKSGGQSARTDVPADKFL